MRSTPLLLSLIPASLLAVDRPNIILIMVDDMGISDILPYGTDLWTERGIELVTFSYGIDTDLRKTMR